MKKVSVFFVCCIFLTGHLAAQPALIEKVKAKPGEDIIPFEKYILPNGMTVVLTEDHSSPLVYVNVSYHVGSAREEIGKSGFAHFFEHMMFEGSDHVKSGEHFHMVNEAGGDLNGRTSSDKTEYYETVPSNQLEKMLWLEADRMGFLLDAVTEPKFEIQRSTVKNERGQNYDNRPYGLAREAISKALYPYGHPYSWLTIGYVEDLNRVDVDDLKRFFLRWYGPNNATLTIGGDIDVSRTLEWIQKYFGSIPRGPEVKRTVIAAPVVTSDRYVSYTDNYASLPLLYIGYPGVKLYDADAPALDALSMIIGEGKQSMLYQAFEKTRLAADASMSSDNLELSGMIGVQVIPYPGLTLAAAKQKVDSVLKAFESRGVSDDDLERFKGDAESRLVKSMGSVAGKASILAKGQVFADDPKRIAKDMQAIRAVTKADILRVYEKYIKGHAAVFLSVLPKGNKIVPAAPDDYVVDTGGYVAPNYGYEGLVYHKPADNFDRSIPPPAGAAIETRVPAFWTGERSNGIKVIGAYSGETPAVSLKLSVKGGPLWAVADSTKAGLASVVAQMLEDATQQHSAEEISNALEKLGSSVDVSAGIKSIDFEVFSLSRNLDATLKILQERLFQPKFTEEALSRIKKAYQQGFQQQKTRAAALAYVVFARLLYPPGDVRAYAWSGTEKTVASITLADVQAFYDRYFAPNLTSVQIVGDVPEAAAKAKLSFLDNWRSKPLSVPAFDSTGRSFDGKVVYLVDVRGAAQSEIRIGYAMGITYDATGLAYRLGLTNYILGGGFNSRLNMDLREAKGWTYGVNSAFQADQYGGYWFMASGIRASATDSAVAEAMHDIRTFASQGISSGDLDFMQHAIGAEDALKYANNSAKLNFLAHLQEYGLKPDYVRQQTSILKGIKVEEINALAGRYLNPDQMAILVVGDEASILPGLKKLGYKIVELNTDGKPL